MSKKRQVKSRRKVQEESGAHIAIHIVLCAVIFIGVFVAYISTVNYPFQFDDLHRIVENQHIRSFKSVWSEYPLFSGQRFTVNLTLWMNYAMGARDAGGIPLPGGMRFFNILIHAVNGILVYLLVLKLLPAFIKRRDESRKPENGEPSGIAEFLRTNALPVVAFFSALIFVLHPVQTQSVTYIIQRAELLGTFFALLILLLYISLVPSGGLVSFIIKILAIIVAFIFALESKEWVPVLVLLILITDYIILSGGYTRRFIKRSNDAGAPIFFMAIIVGVFLYNLSKTYKGELDAGFSTSNITHSEYFLSQFNVIAYYVRLLFVPSGLRLDYDFPVMQSLFQFPVYLSILFMVFLIVVAVATFRRSPVLCFGISWFLIALAPTAGIIPIADLIYEHRLYFPMLGFAIPAAYFIWRLFQTDFLRRIEPVAPVILLCIVIVYGVGTVQRNRIWSSVESLWADSAEKSPGKARPQMNLGKYYLDMHSKEGNISHLEKGRMHLEKAVELEPSSESAWHHLGRIYQRIAQTGDSPKDNLEKARNAYLKAGGILEDKIEVMDKQIRTEGEYDDDLRKNLEKVARHYRRTISDVYHDIAVSHEHNDTGVRYGEGFDVDKAVEAYDVSLKYLKTNERLWNRAVALVNGGKIEEGAEAVRDFAQKTGQVDIASNFYRSGFGLAGEGNVRLARHYLATALILQPEHPDAGKARQVLPTLLED